MASLHLYSRRGCHLCEVMIEQLLEIDHSQVRIEIHDVDKNAEWLEKYDLTVPVLEFDGRVLCTAHLDKDAVAAALATATRD